MRLVFSNLPFDNVLVVDVEFDNYNILQFSALLFVREEKDQYRLNKTINFYVIQEKVGKYAAEYTGINSQFLMDHGIPLQKMREEVNKVLSELDLSKTVFVSHGVKNDRKVLKNSEILLPHHSYCTYKNAAKILKRDNHLSLGVLAEEANFKILKEHDAYWDAWATAAVLSFLTRQNLS